MRARFLTILFCLFVISSAAQDQNRLKAYDQKIITAKKDEEKIAALAELAEYYSAYKLEAKSDSVLRKALLLAELSSDQELVFKVFFDYNVTSLSKWSSKESVTRSIDFIQKGLRYAQEHNRIDYIALAHIRLAGIFRKFNQYDEAIQQATQAFSVLASKEADSLRSILYIELGDIYSAKTDASSAYRNYNNAFDIAYKQKIYRLQSEIYHRFSELYRSFGDNEKGKRYLMESLSLNSRPGYKNIEGQIKDNIALARITDERSLIDKADSLAGVIKSDRYKLAAKQLSYYLYMVNGKNSVVTFNYLFDNPDLVQIFKNQGIAYFHWQKGNIFRYSTQYDSALYYYHLAEKDLTAGYGIGNKLDISTGIAETYLENNDSSNSRVYYEKTFALSKQINQVGALPNICKQLGMLHSKNANYQEAYYYAIQADSANKLLQSSAAKDKVTLLQVERENKQREMDLLEAIHKKETKNNVQIRLITLLITGIFALMLLSDYFPYRNLR